MKWFIAMLVGSLSGWLVASVTNEVLAAAIIGGAIGVLATIAVAGTRPARALAKLIGAMSFGFIVSWAVGMAVGDHLVGIALIIPLSLPILALLTDSIVQPRRRRPF